MVRIPWDALAKNPRASESLVTLLMLRLRGRAQAVDGSGGDGGRDLFEYTEDGQLVIYEAKSFTGRMDGGRRTQVVRSLTSAARHQPDHWDLLVPIDANPSEQRWFDSLRKEFPFVRHWLGRSWLDQELAAHPDLVRYALEESGDYILERIVEARAERDVLLSVPDYVGRVRALHARGQEISPHYALHTSLGADGQSVVRLVPKGPDPTGKASVRFVGRVRFRDGDSEDAQRRRRFEETMRFGGEVELTADNLAETSLAGPKELGLGSVALGGMRITSPRQELATPLRGQLTVQQSSGMPLTSMPLEFTHRTTGQDGGTLHGGDLSGLLQVRLRVENSTRAARMTFSFDPPRRTLPQNPVPVLRLIAHARPGRILELRFAGDSGGQLSTPVTTGMTPGCWEPDEAQWWADAFDDLARLQSRTGRFFPVPEDFTRSDVLQVKEILALLDGETVTLKGDSVSVGVISEEALRQLADSPSSMIRLTAEYESMLFVLGDNEIDLGPCVETFTLDKVLNFREAQREIRRTGQGTVRLRVAQHFPATRYLGTERLPDPAGP